MHRPDLFGWSRFDEKRNVDFNSLLWVREDGNVLIDPLPLSAHDREHLGSLGGARWILLTTSDHLRGAFEVAETTGAEILGPAAEKTAFQSPLDGWLSEGAQLLPGLEVFEMRGAKTPGELALLLGGTTLVTGDLIRAHQGGSLMMLKDSKLTDPRLARESVRRLARNESIEAVLVGDGWPVFREGHARLLELVKSFPNGGPPAERK